jgi:hypothetical protein
MPPLRILIADDHDVMREGTRAVIERQAGCEVCRVAATAVRSSSRPLHSSPIFIFKSEAHHFLVEAIRSLSQDERFFRQQGCGNIVRKLSGLLYH